MTEDDYLIEIDKAEIGLEKANSALAVLDHALQISERDLSKFAILEQHYIDLFKEVQEANVVVLQDYVTAKKRLDECHKMVETVNVKKLDMLSKKAELQTTISIFVKSINSLRDKAQKAESKKVLTYDFRRNTKLDKKR